MLFVNWFHAWAINGGRLDNRIFQHSSSHSSLQSPNLSADDLRDCDVLGRTRFVRLCGASCGLVALRGHGPEQSLRSGSSVPRVRRPPGSHYQAATLN